MLFILVTVTSIREKIVDYLPQNIKVAITSSIGLFIALIGLKSGGIIISNPGTLVGFGNFMDKGVLLTIMGIALMGILMARKVKGAMLIAILATTIIGIPMGITDFAGAKLLSMPPSVGPTLMKMDFKGLLGAGGSGIIGAITSVIMVVLTFSLVDLFDTIGTLVGTAQKANMIQEDGKIKNMKRALLTDAIATTTSALFGGTTTSTYVESTAGIAEGGRTGLTSLVVGILFIFSLFLGGIVGIIFYPIMKLATGKYKDVHPVMYILAVLFILRFILLPQ